jgi:hypothetical protein
MLMNVKEEIKKCDFCGVSLWSSRSNHRNYLYYQYFLDTGKCQKCQDYDEFMGWAKPKLIKNIKRAIQHKAVADVDIDRFNK